MGTTTIGGQRVGSGNKMKAETSHYERSSHDLGYTWKSTMSPGTLVPFLKELALPGDAFDIDLNCDVLTHPTIGPLFGSFKVQLDVFLCPIRLYQAELHQNMVGIGNKMSDIKLPQVRIKGNSPSVGNTPTLDNFQINPSSIFAHLDIRGAGVSYEPDSPPTTWKVQRDFNAIPYLSYFDIYKNYYANQQEEIGYIIHNDVAPTTIGVAKVSAYDWENNNIPLTVWNGTSTTIEADIIADGNVIVEMDTVPLPNTFNVNRIGIAYIKQTGTPIQTDVMKITQMFENVTVDHASGKIYAWGVIPNKDGFQSYSILGYRYETGSMYNSDEPQLTDFKLSQIDDMKQILLRADYGTPVTITYDGSFPTVYKLPLQEETGDFYSKTSSQEGLLIKTYQSDYFNNWLSTEWIDGDNGINAITAVPVNAGEFTINDFLLNKRLYELLNDIAISGGTYDDWISAVYDEDGTGRYEIPMYIGGLSKELTFQEVISQTPTEGFPLGSLAGRGVLTNKHKGGEIKVRVKEPSYIIGIVSLTPRICYSQGNKWDVNLKTMDDLHKPKLDQIGYQDLPTDEMAWWDTRIFNELGGEIVMRSAGKQPAWLHYMTNVDKVRGNFADDYNQMYMTLNRRYEPLYINNESAYSVQIKDLTTYIDPSKYNYIFADTRLDAQNFWTQIKVDIFARRKMSARLQPNV